MKYKIREITPREMRCVIGTCPTIYEITPKDMRCIAAACPTIYEITPKDMRCVVGACNKIYNNEEKSEYLIIGTQVNPKNLPKDFGLEGKVGEGEVLISVPKKLIDEKEN